MFFKQEVSPCRMGLPSCTRMFLPVPNTSPVLFRIRHAPMGTPPSARPFSASSIASASPRVSCSLTGSVVGGVWTVDGGAIGRCCREVCSDSGAAQGQNRARGFKAFQSWGLSCLQKL